MNIQIIKKSKLFKNMEDEEISLCLKLLNAKEKTFQKGERILSAGDKTKAFGLVCSGSVTVEINDVWGNRNILSHIGALDIFAETYALLKNETLLVDAYANECAEILFLNIADLDDTSQANERWALKFIFNMLTISAGKNLALSKRSFHTSPKTIRDRVLSYLNTVSLQNHSAEFDIPFDRQQLADYLNVDRSALSNELGKLQKEKIIKLRKNHFELFLQ